MKNFTVKEVWLPLLVSKILRHPKVFLLCLMLFAAGSVHAQKQVVLHGTVSDESGQPLPGVTVMIRHSQKGTSTDAKGHYMLRGQTGDSLQFSYLGYDSRTVVVGTSASVSIRLSPSNRNLNEVVVVGYGTQQQKDVTGSVAAIKMPAIRDQPITSASDALAGQIAGVNVSSSNGIPGGGPKVQIRGVGAIGAGSEPLYVVDGFPLPTASNSQTSNPLADIPPEDIASITVLKDASATAIYGSRGANGVVIINTKSGSAGKLTFNVDAYMGYQQIPDIEKPKLMNAEQFATFMKERVEDDNAVTGQNNPVPAIYQNPSALAGKGTDWYDAITRNAAMRNFNFSVSGGNDKITSYLSGGYLQQDGVVLGTSYDRYSFRANIRAHISPKLSLGINFAPTYSKGSNEVEGGQGRYEAAFGYAIVASPIPPVYNPDGSYNVMIQSPGTFNYPNPVMLLNEYTNTNNKARVISSGFVQYDILAGLSLKSTINVDWYDENGKTFLPSTIGAANAPPPSVASGTYTQDKYLNWANENTLTYEHAFPGGHHITAVANLSEQKQINNSAGFTGTQFPDDQIQTLNAASLITGSTSDDGWALASYLGRINYSYKEIYLLTATIRRDGSSRFGQQNRWGTFPSVAVGWRLTGEPWMQSTASWMSNLKIRASYGITGNDQIGNFTYDGQVGINNYVVGGSNLAHGKTVNTLGNPILGWEKTKEINLGLDAGLLNDRISVSADFYQRKTTDLLLNLEIPQSSGFANAVENMGEVQNKGVEVAINTVNIDHHDFKWTTNFNISFNRNKTLALGPDNTPIMSGTSGEGHYTNITEVGKPVGMLFGYKFLGLYRSEDEIQKEAAFPGAIPGNMRMADINGDGTITPISDYTIIGNPYPKFSYGLTNMLQYKGLTLRVLLTGSYGADRLKASYEYFHNIDGVFNVLTDVIDRWHSADDPGNGKVPTTAGPSFARVMYRDVSSLWVYKSSYLWVKNLMLSYSLPPKWSTGFLSGIQVYGSVQNAFIFTHYPGNPAVEHYGAVHGHGESALIPGIDFSTYPVPRIFTLGIKLSY